MKSSVLASSVAVLLSVAACGDSDRNQLVGQWQGVQNEQPMIVTFAADSTFTMDTGSFVGEGTYTVDAERQIVLSPTGPLAVSVPAGFTGSVQDYMMNLCAPSGICTDFEKVE